MAMRIRAAQENDIPAINAIHKHYVENTIITFALTPKTDVAALEAYQDIAEKGLPYLVAVHGEATDTDAAAVVVGFAYASGFRQFKGGYKFTVELTIFLHPDHVNKGAGTLLLTKLIECLREPDNCYPEFVGKLRPSDERIRQVIAVVSLDEDDKEVGLALRDFYRKFGFEEVGHLKKVGHKLDKW
jgi:L-amino acid N-acyltransferase YncA